MKGKKEPTAKSTKKTRANAVSPPSRKDSGLNLMIQLHESKNLRKDILEGLREIIIFMQGYEAFRKIQEEKVKTFAQLRDDVKALNSLLDTKLRRYLPKGKLAGVVKKAAAPRRETASEEKGFPPAREPLRMAKPEPAKEESSELDELEQQLRDIESRLKGM